MSTLLALLDAGDAHPTAVELRTRSYELLGDIIGRPVADVGCGGGRAVAELAERGARAIGVDLDPEMIAVCRQRLPGGEFHVADAAGLPFENGSLAGYRTDKVLHLLDDPARAVAEARRVLAPGGRAALLGSDWDSIAVDSGDPETTRRVVHAKAESFPSPRVVRQFRALLLDAGFADVTVEARSLVLTDDTGFTLLQRLTDDEPWLADQASRLRADRIFVAVPMVLAAGTRAGPAS